MTKALHLCRHLRAAGWRVVLVETHKYWHVGSRLSNSVNVFATVPVPELHPAAYTQAIAGVCRVGVLNARCMRSTAHSPEPASAQQRLSSHILSTNYAGMCIAPALLLPCVKPPADIAKREGATLFIPVSSPIASLYDALASQALPQGCRCVQGFAGFCTCACAPAEGSVANAFVLSSVGMCVG